jgi:hypothetical protein
MSAEQIEHMKKQMTTLNRELVRLSDVEKVSLGLGWQLYSMHSRGGGHRGYAL